MFVAAAFVFGAIIGSFLNVWVIRRGARPLSGRSECLSCGARIHWYDNIPIVSWIVLHGACRFCGSSVSAQYPIVELLAGILFAVLAAAHAPIVQMDSVELLTLLLEYTLASLTLAIAVYDIRHTIIPDTWVYAAGIAALALGLMTHVSPVWMTLLAAPATALPLFALWAASRGAWMGLGDVKLAFAIGWVLGPLFGIFSIFLAFIIGAVVSVCILLPLPHLMRVLSEKGIARLSTNHATFTMKSEVAFGPFLVAAFFFSWIALLYHIPLPI